MSIKILLEKAHTIPFLSFGPNMIAIIQKEFCFVSTVVLTSNY